MIKFGIIGCGRIALRHATLLTGGSIPHAKLVTVCDNVRERAKQFGDQFSVPHYFDYIEMLENEDLDVVVVLSESGNHAKHSIDAARYYKHVIVEKPMALSLDDADKMIAACDEVGRKLFVVKQNRFNLPVVKARQAIEGGRLGKLVLGTVRVRWCRTQEYYDQDAWRGTWAYDGGVLTNQASHHIDLLEWMLGDVVSVQAMSETALVDIEAEDTAVVILRFKSGALGVIEATTATRPKDLEGSLSILGEKGTIEISGFAVNELKVWNFTESEPGDDEVLKKYSCNPPDVYGFGHQAFYLNVIDCLENGKKQLIDGIEGRKSLELINAIYESIETRREVNLRFSPNNSRLGKAS